MLVMSNFYERSRNGIKPKVVFKAHVPFPYKLNVYNILVLNKKVFVSQIHVTKNTNLSLKIVFFPTSVTSPPPCLNDFFFKLIMDLILF